MIPTDDVYHYAEYAKDDIRKTLARTDISIEQRLHQELMLELVPVFMLWLHKSMGGPGKVADVASAVSLASSWMLATGMKTAHQKTPDHASVVIWVNNFLTDLHHYIELPSEGTIPVIRPT